MILWAIISISPVLADPLNDQSDPSQQFEYAEHLFNHKEYSSAVEEFKRFVYFFPDDERVVTAEYKIGMSNFYIRNYKEALDYFVKVQEKSASSEMGFKSGLMISRIYSHLNDKRSAADSLNYLLSVTKDINRRDKIFYHLGWLFIESGDANQARRFFDEITKSNQQSFAIESLNDQLDKFKDIPQKKPLVAGLLSIVPGGGYLYCGRYQDALVAFVVNSALIYGAYESFDENLYALGGIISVVELGFYAGSMYGGISSAHKYNKAKQTEYIHSMEKNLKFNIFFDANSKKILLGAVYRF
ncbi:MAG: tetratricopeptide repeat protein [Dissulfuribacterales bacterium]